jgi:hypothetical protein
MTTPPTPDPRNARTHSDRNKSAVRASLRDSGAGRSVLLDNDDVIIAGNCAVEQATDLGIPIRVIDSDGSELIAVRRTDLGTDDRRRAALAIADNRTTDLSEFDDAAVADILRDFDVGELASAGFDPVEYAALLEIVAPGPDPDPDPDPPALSYSVEIAVDSETQQRALFDEMTGRGYQCKVVTF